MMIWFRVNEILTNEGWLHGDIHRTALNVVGGSALVPTLRVECFPAALRPQVREKTWAKISEEAKPHLLTCSTINGLPCSANRPLLELLWLLFLWDAERPNGISTQSVGTRKTHPTTRFP